MSVTLLKGENKIIRRNLFQSDGTTPLNVSSLSLAKVTLIQNGTTIVTYTYGTNPELRLGTAANQLELELKKTVTAALLKGSVIIEWEFEIASTEFVVDGVNNQQFRETAVYVSD
jgi:hypothetical protein